LETINSHKVILIGGSAGSFPIVSNILEALPKGFPVPIVICLHRLKSVRTGFEEIFSLVSKNHVVEPFHNQDLLPGRIYVAPANYHILIEDDLTFSLSTEEVVNFSRPSIDVLFASAAPVLLSSAIGIILSGANEDGADGLLKIKEYGGVTIVQDPLEAQVSIMPEAVIKKAKPMYVLQTQSIIAYIKNLV